MTNLEMVRKLFPAFNWAAKDENGKTWLYTDKPVLGSDDWQLSKSNGSQYHFQKWSGVDLELSDNWKESLTELHPIKTITMIQEWITSLKWIATDSRGNTHIYEHKPKLIDGEWQASSIAGLVMSINYQYYFDGYESSLRKLKWE